MADDIKKSLKERSKSTKIFYKNGQRKTHRENVLEKPTECANEILEAEKKYILKMNKTLEDSHTALKTYWTIINRLTYDEKIPAIPPLFFDDNLILDFCAKAKMFNNHFASICTPIKNANVIPPLSYKTNARINYFISRNMEKSEYSSYT